jgi:sensor domain CHASE-containing protein
MKLHRKTLTTVGATLVCLILILYVVSWIFLDRRSVAFEEEAVRKDLRRAQITLQEQLASLDSKAVDWSNWDDTYSFVRDCDSAYIKSNLLDKMFEDLSLNVVLFFDTSGHVVFSKCYDLTAGREMPMWPGLAAALPFRRTNGTPLAADVRLKGLLLVPEGGMLLIRQPILTAI